MAHYNPGDNFGDAKVGDTITNWYGETATIVGESERGYFWSVRYPSGRVAPVHKWSAESIIGVSDLTML